VTLSAHDELDRMFEQSNARLALALGSVAGARMRGNEARAQELIEKLGRDLGNLMASADMLGRYRMALELKAAGIDAEEVIEEGAHFSRRTPRVPFLEAVRSLVQRTPFLSRVWSSVRQAWSAEGRAIAVRTANIVSLRVREDMVSAMRRGATPDDASAQILKSLRESDSSITRAYADTVFRTNTARAYSDGRKAQALRPGVRRAAPGWRFDATNDDAVRVNHFAGEGVIAHVDDPIWETHTPPLGFNCRCAIEVVPLDELVRLGIADRNGNMIQTFDASSRIGWRPDIGFQAVG